MHFLVALTRLKGIRNTIYECIIITFIELPLTEYYVLNAFFCFEGRRLWFPELF